MSGGWSISFACRLVGALVSPGCIALLDKVSPSPYPIRESFTDKAKEGLAETVNTHRVNPIPAYDVRGDLIDPPLYRSRLCGAIAEVHKFELTHSKSLLRLFQH